MNQKFVKLLTWRTYTPELITTLYSDMTDAMSEAFLVDSFLANIR